MAITNYLVHFKTEETFTANKSQLRNDAVAFVGDATIIHTHGTDYYCGKSEVALKTDLDGKANSSHTHSATDITSGTLGVLYGGTGRNTSPYMLVNLESTSSANIFTASPRPGVTGTLPITSGGTGAWSAAEARTNLGFTLANLGVTATATELNYVDGVKSNIQTQLDNKAEEEHKHSAEDITSGTLDISRLPSITDAKITSISADKITGTIPQENLPSYVDDVLEYNTKSGFPQTGETGKIYVDLTTNLTYRWGGSNYVEISPSIALGETSSTAYRGDRGKIAYDHSQETGNPHNLTLSNLGISVTADELNYMDGVTSNVQDQLGSKVSQDWVEAQGYLTSVSWAEVSGKPSTFTPAAHTHSASDITSGTLSISRIPTGTSASTVALGNHTHSGYATSSHTHGTDDVTALTGYIEGLSTTTLSSSMDLNEALASLQNQIQERALVETLDDYALKTEIPEIPDISNLATKTELAGYLPLTGGTLSGDLIMSNESSIKVGTIGPVSGSSVFFDSNVDMDSFGFDTVSSISGDTGLTLKSDSTGTNGDITLLAGQHQVILDQGGFTYDGDQILTEANWDDYITSTDTKDTAGTANSTSKLYLIGGRTQSSTGIVTYSNTSVYMQSGQLYATRMNATNGFYETSDGTLKNIKSELNIADNIDKIPTVLFSWKKDESEDINQDVPVHVGTIAQDIQKIYPDLVSEDAEGHLTVDYARLSVVAIAAIKELKKEIEVLKSKIN